MGKPSSGGMPLPGGASSTYANTMDNIVNPALDKATSGNLPPFLQMLMQSVKGFTGGQGSQQPTPGSTPNAAPAPSNPQSMLQAYMAKMMAQGPHFAPQAPLPTPTPPPPTSNPTSVGGGFWHFNPNQGMPSPTIANTSSQNSGNTPFAMPKESDNTIGSQVAAQQGAATGGGVPPPAPSSGGMPPPPATHWWDNLNIPPSSVSGQKWGGPGFAGNNSWINGMPKPPATGTAIT